MSVHWFGCPWEVSLLIICVILKGKKQFVSVSLVLFFFFFLIHGLPMAHLIIFDKIWKWQRWYPVSKWRNKLVYPDMDYYSTLKGNRQWSQKTNRRKLKCYYQVKEAHLIQPCGVCNSICMTSSVGKTVETMAGSLVAGRWWGCWEMNTWETEDPSSSGTNKMFCIIPKLW